MLGLAIYVPAHTLHQRRDPSAAIACFSDTAGDCESLLLWLAFQL